jgi:hypothetical protein
MGLYLEGRVSGMFSTRVNTPVIPVVILNRIHLRPDTSQSDLFVQIISILYPV